MSGTAEIARAEKQQPPAPTPRSQAVVLALGAVLLWATWPALALVAVPAPPFYVLAVAALAGFIASATTFALRGQTRAFFATPLRTQVVVALGLLGTNGFFLFAMPRIGAAEASIIGFLWPILLIMILSRRDGVRLTGPQKIGMVAGFAGAVLVIGPTLDKEFDLGGILLAFCSGLSFAVYSALRTRGQEAHGVVGPSMGVLALVAFALHLLTETSVSMDRGQWLSLVCMGVLSLTISNGLWDRATRSGHMATVSSITYLTPLVSLFLLAGLGMEIVSASAVAGGVLVVAGAFIVARSGVKRKKGTDQCAPSS